MIINDFSQELENITSQLSSTSSGINTVVDGLNNLITGFAGISSAMSPVITNGSELISKVKDIQGLFNGGISLVKAATDFSSTGAAAGVAGNGVKSFGTALNSALGIAGLVAMAVTTLIGIFTEMGKADEATQKLVDGMNEAINASKESTLAQSNSLAATKAQGEVATDLASRLVSLQGITNRSTSEQLEMTSAVSQLNAIYPDLNLSINESTGKLNKNTIEIFSSISAMQKEAEEAAKKEYYNELVKQQLELDTKKKVLQEELGSVLESENRELIKNLSNQEILLGMGKMTNEQAVSTIANTGAKIEAYDALSAEEQNVTDQLAVLTEGTDLSTISETTNSEATLASAEAIRFKMLAGQEFTDADIANAEALIESGNVYTEAEAEQLQSQIDAQEAAKEEYARILEERVALATNAFSTINEGEAVSVDSMINNLNTNTEAMKTWTENMNTLAGSDLDKGFLQELRDKGPEAGAQVAAMVEFMGSSAYDNFEGFNTALSESTDAAALTLNAGLTNEEATSAGGEMMTETAASVTTSTALTDSVVQQVIDTKTAMTAQVSASGFTDVGSNIVSTVIQGLNGKAAELYTQANRITGETKNQMANQVTASDFPGIGRSMIDGAIQGVNDRAPDLYRRAQEIANETARIMRSALDEHSPSKVSFKIFSNFGEGAVLGLDSKLQAIRDKSGEFAGASMQSMTGGLYQSVANTANTSSKTQNFGPIVIQQPVKTPAETARAIKREMVMLLG